MHPFRTNPSRCLSSFSSLQTTCCASSIFPHDRHLPQPQSASFAGSVLPRVWCGSKLGNPSRKLCLSIQSCKFMFVSGFENLGCVHEPSFEAFRGRLVLSSTCKKYSKFPGSLQSLSSPERHRIKCFVQLPLFFKNKFVILKCNSCFHNYGDECLRSIISMTSSRSCLSL